jgi:hypothetical protein
MMKAFATGFGAALAFCAVLATIIVGEVWLLQTLHERFGMFWAIAIVALTVCVVVGFITAANSPPPTAQEGD